MNGIYLEYGIMDMIKKTYMHETVVTWMTNYFVAR